MADESRTLSLNATVYADTHLLYYVYAVAYEGLGRTDDAIRAAKTSVRRRPNTSSQQLLARLTAAPASDTAS